MIAANESNFDDTLAKHESILFYQILLSYNHLARARLQELKEMLQDNMQVPSSKAKVSKSSHQWTKLGIEYICHSSTLYTLLTGNAQTPAFLAGGGGSGGSSEAVL